MPCNDLIAAEYPDGMYLDAAGEDIVLHQPSSEQSGEDHMGLAVNTLSSTSAWPRSYLVAGEDSDPLSQDFAGSASAAPCSQIELVALDVLVT